ncbi:MAG: uracil-DNA glycosylase [Rhizobiales bacterium 65-9]|mgnify:CR=1 FL=1|nr:uracil-DNA glycosylase [Hyphomicrobiales bacterium]OJY32855.1 MAG: uracil-DNA glycosylase [Rhizobiales bacterium 65-9]
MTNDDYAAALDRFLRDPASKGWRDLPFFRNGSAERVIARVTEREKAGARILPTPGDMLNALRLTPLDSVRVVILGQDPYPTPGHANGLAFSYIGEGALPASLRNIFKELQSDVGGDPQRKGDLSRWARQGALLLNTALTVEAGAAGAHMRYGWSELTKQVVEAVSARPTPAVFILWGDKARAYGALIDPRRHLVIDSAHPSPLSARRGFFGSKPFSRANDFLKAHGERAIDW